MLIIYTQETMMMSKPCCCWNSIQKPSTSFAGGAVRKKTSSSSSSSFAKEQRRSLRSLSRRRMSTRSSYDNDYEDIDNSYEDDDDYDAYDDDEEKGGSIDSEEETNVKKFNLALAFDDDDDDEVAKRFLVSSIYRMASEENLYTGTLINEVYVLKSIDDKIRIKSEFKTVVLDFRRRRRRTGGGFGDSDDDDDDDVKYVKVFHDDDGDDNTLVGKKGKLVSLLPPSSDTTSPSKTNPSITKLLKLITVNVLQNRNLVKTGPHDFLAYHLFASSLGAFKKRSGALDARRKIREGYVRLCLSQNAENDSKENTINYYIFFNLSSQTSKWNALQAYESFRLKNNNNNIKVIPVALVYGENNEENETIDRSSFVWIFNNRNHMHDFYQCVYADSGWREAETLIFAKKNNKNTWPERFRKDLLLEFPKRREKEDLERTTPSVITVAAFAQGVAKSSIVFIAPNMSEKNNNHKNDCTLRKLFQSAGITFTGTSAAFATRAADRVFLSSALNNSKVKIPGVMGIPKKVILQSALTVMAEEYVEKNEFLSSVSNIQRAVRTYAEASKELNCAELCIKSQFYEQNSSKITRIRSAKDLETFAYECRRNRRFSSNNNIQNNFILEPFVETGKVVDFQFVQREESSSESRWLKIYVGGIGPEGKMKALDPACPVGVPEGRRKGKTHAYLDCVKDGKTKKLLFDEKKIESVVKPRIERVLNLTGISGVAMLRCFVNVDSGELIVEDVDHSPDMTERNGTFYHQALRYFHREERDNDLYGKDERSINSSSSSSISTNDGEDDVKNDEKSIEAIDEIAIKKGLENTSFFTRLIAIAMFK